MKSRGHSDERTQTGAPARKPWVKPEVKVISAGSAELNAGFNDDSFDVS